MEDVPVHRVVLKDYPDIITVLETLMMHADYAALKAAQATIQSDFFEHQKWDAVHKALERCATEISHAGQLQGMSDEGTDEIKE